MRKLVCSIIMVTVCISSFVSAETTVPTNYEAKYMELANLKDSLTTNGFMVLGTHQVAESNEYTVVVYTSKDLLKAAKKSDRGFIAALHILHNSNDREIVASNPEYFMRAFMQKEYKEGMAKPVVDALTASLGSLTATKDSLSPKDLKKYKFMMGMPKYDDFVRVGKGTTAELLKKLNENSKDSIVFTKKLNEDGSTVLCSVALSNEIESFNQTLGTMGQSHLLPYSVLIEDGEAKIMHAKYYLALNFPNLTMGEFMKIMSVPGDIKDEFKKMFK